MTVNTTEKKAARLRQSQTGEKYMQCLRVVRDDLQERASQIWRDGSDDMTPAEAMTEARRELADKVKQEKAAMMGQVDVSE